VNGALMLLPFISGGAHVGGLAAGFALTGLLCRGEFVLDEAPPIWVRALARALCLVCATAVGIAAWDLWGRGELGRRYTERIARLPGIASPVLHLRAVEVLADPRASRAELLAALSAEERAVDATFRKQPEMLAGLAELQYRLGRSELALATIEEALALAPDDRELLLRRARILQGEPAGPGAPGELPPWLPDPRESSPLRSVET
jgi:hypothetical protein